MTRQCVLVIASDLETRVQVHRRLEREGHNVIAAASSAEATSLLNEIKPPDLILMNPALFAMSPAQFLGFVRTTPGFQNVPIAQIGSPEIQIEGTCCRLTLDDLDFVVRWLTEMRLAAAVQRR